MNLGSAGASYKILVALGLVDDSAAGLRSFTSHVQRTTANVQRLQKKISSYGIQYLGPQTVAQARKSLAQISTLQAQYRERAMTAQRRQDVTAHKINLQALGVTKASLQAEAMKLQLQERQATVQKGMADRAARDAIIQQRATMAQNLAQSRSMASLQRQRTAQGRREETVARRGAHTFASVGMYSGLAGGALLGGLYAAASEAATYYQTALNTFLAMNVGRTTINDLPYRNAFINQLMTRTQSAAEKTKFLGPMELMQGYQTFATSGSQIIGPAEFMRALPALAQFADAMQALKGMAPAESMREAVVAAHMMQQYKAIGIQDAMNRVTAMALLSPDDVRTNINSLSQFLPLGRKFGIPDNQLIAMQLALSQQGMGQGRVGARAMSFILGAAIQPTAGKMAAAQQLGLVDASGRNLAIGAGGGIDLNKLTAILISANKRLGWRRDTQDVEALFGMAGTKVASLLANPQALKLMQQNFQIVTQAMAGDASAALQSIMARTPLGAKIGFFKQFQAAIIDFGMAALPDLTKFFTQLTAVIKKFDAWQQADPRRATQVFKTVEMLGASLLAFSAINYGVAAGAKVFEWAGMLRGLFAADGIFGVVGAWVARGAFLLPIALRFAGVIGLIVGALQLAANFPDIARKFVAFWNRNYPQIMTVLADIVYDLGAGIHWAFDELLSIVKKILVNFKTYLLPDAIIAAFAPAMLPRMMQAQWNDIIKGLPAAPPGSPSDYFVQELQRRAAIDRGEQPTQINIHGPIVLPQVQDPRGFIDALKGVARTAMRTQGETPAGIPTIPGQDMGGVPLFSVR